jgi:hypothetical protein
MLQSELCLFTVVTTFFPWPLLLMNIHAFIESVMSVCPLHCNIVLK